MEFFFGGTMLYWIALALLATVVPMRLLAEELRSGTIEPLLTAPVTRGRGRDRQVAGRARLLRDGVGADAALPRLPARRRRARWTPGRSRPATSARCCIGAAAMAVGLLASALTRNQLVAATLSFVAFFVVLLVGALEGQVRSPALAAVAAPR